MYWKDAGLRHMPVDGSNSNDWKSHLAVQEFASRDDGDGDDDDGGGVGEEGGVVRENEDADCSCS